MAEDDNNIEDNNEDIEQQAKNHNKVIIAVILIVIILAIGLTLGLYFGLRNKGEDTPEEVNPDPEIVEPGPSLCDHIWDDEVIILEPTCTEIGIIEYTCIICGDTLDEEIPSLGHNKSEIGYLLLDYGDTTGLVDFPCTRCHTSLTEERDLYFSSDTWEEISEYASSGEASSRYYIGETKEISIQETSSNVNTATVEKDEYGQWWITPVLSGYGDATLTVTASYEGYESDIRTAIVTVQEAEEVSTVTGISFAQESYELTVGTPKEFVYGTDIIFEGTGTHSQDFELSVEATYESVITISGNTVTASKAVENITLTVTATGSDVVGEVKATTTISAAGGTEAPEVTGVEFIDDSGATTSTFTVKLSEVTLDLTNHVKVLGTGDYSEQFTLELTSTNPSGCATLSGNVLTAVSEGTATITVTAGSHTATATVTIEDDNVYVESISFALESYQLWTGEIDTDHPEEMVVGVSVKYTNQTTSEETSAYTISIAQGGESYVSYDQETKTLKAVNDGSTTITATSTEQKKDGSNATATVGVTVSHNNVLVKEIHFSSSTWEVKEQESFTIGPSGVTADVTVTTDPTNADESSWKLSTEDTNITISDQPDGSGVYTVTASALTNSGVTESASITVTPTSGKEGVSDTLGISIVPYDSDITYVSSITLNPTEKTIDELEEFAIGTEGGVTVAVEPEDATDPSYTVSCESDLISVTGSGDSWTVKALEGAGGEEAGGQTYDVVVKANDGHGESSTLKLTVNRPESVPTEITVTGGDDLGLTSHNEVDQSDADSINLRNTLTVTVTDQYGEEYEGEGGSNYTLSTTSTDLITLDDTTGVVTAVAGASGTATVTVTSVADDTLTASVSIAVTPKTYEVTSISVDPTSATVEWGESTTATVSITPVYADDTTYTVTSDKTSSEELFDVEINESTITFTHKKTHSGTETFTISANGGDEQECTIELTANPEILEPQSASFDGIATTLEKGTVISNLTETYLKVNFDEASHNEGDYVDDDVTVAYASSNTAAITVKEDGSALTCVGNGEATITATIKAEHLTDPIYAAITITVVTSMTGITLDTTNLSLDIVSDPTHQLVVTFEPEDTTDAKEVTWASNATNVATVSDEGLVTAVGVGSAEITAKCGEFTAKCYVTVTRPALESYTINFTINGYSGSALGSKDGITVYGAGDFDSWVEHLLTDNNNGVFTLSLTTLPTNGTSVNLYASETGNSDDDMWATQLCSYTFAITGDEYGEVVIDTTVTVTHESWNTWDDIFPEHTDTEFYITLWYKNSSNDSSSVKTLASGASYFNGSDSSNVTTKTASTGQTYQYNATAGKATESTGYSSWFTFHNGSWSNEHSCGTLSIASSDSGCSVYIAETDGTYTYVAWENLTAYGVVDGWATNVADFDAFTASIADYADNGTWLG